MSNLAVVDGKPLKNNQLFQPKIFDPPLKPPILGPQKKSLCVSFPGKERQKGIHINFLGGGDLGVKEGGPKRAIFSHKKISLCSLCASSHWEAPKRPLC